ncbi:hypothetical protein Rhe02_14570 [Rhizocola hellebori]|uniref:Uncharacterized protein n=1 Tax=Rhizocola hellebori TaxID=1392758 RepID=A0A8J3Q3X9_9ACTN|nr:hypothetical protein [Rhizocola hellebori]GIH03390.1 hypothetical protein Rhe02_14570 [Rhizocola hellebori]
MQSTQNQVTDPVTPAVTLPCTAVDLERFACTDTVAATLLSAADYLERHGWIQASYYDNTAAVYTPPACLVGAIGIVCYGGPVDAPAQMFDDPGFPDFEAAMVFLDFCVVHATEGELTSAYDYNDAKGRTADEVICLLRMVAFVWDYAFGGAQ